MIFSRALAKLSVGAGNTPSLLLLAFALMLLTACSTAPTTHFYLLSAMPQAESASTPNTKQVSVVIRDVRLPQYLERPQIITRGGDNRIQLAEDAQWAGNLQQDMVRVLTENLGRQLKSERVFSAPHNGPIKPDFRLDVEVLRFEQGVDGIVTLSARWWLIRGGDNTLIEAPSITLHGGAMSAPSRDALVASMSAVYGELAQKIAHSIRENSAVAK